MAQRASRISFTIPNEPRTLSRAIKIHYYKQNRQLASRAARAYHFRLNFTAYHRIQITMELYWETVYFACYE